MGTERHLICIEDPFILSHDLGRVVDKDSIWVLRDEFRRAATIMRDSTRPFEELFEEYVRPAASASASAIASAPINVNAGRAATAAAAS